MALIFELMVVLRFDDIIELGLFLAESCLRWLLGVG